MKLSQTAIHEFLRCPKRYQYRYLIRAPAEPSRGQIIGSAGHLALAEWYLSGDAERALALARDRLLEIPMAEVDRFLSVLEEYFHWASRNDDFQVLGTELRFEVELAPGLEFTFVIDGLARKGDGLYVLEHKFNKQFVTRHLETDWQISAYVLLLRELGWPVRGAIYNLIKPHKLPLQVYRTYAVRPPDTLEQFRLDVAGVQQLLQLALDQNVWPRHFNRDCHWDCPFFSPCLLEFYGSAPDELRIDEREVSDE
jgi:hypothetical protein